MCDNWFLLSQEVDSVPDSVVDNDGAGESQRRVGVRSVVDAPAVPLLKPSGLLDPLEVALLPGTQRRLARFIETTTVDRVGKLDLKNRKTFNSDDAMNKFLSRAGALVLWLW